MPRPLSARALAKRTLRTILKVPDRFRQRRVVVFYAWPDFARKAQAIADLLRRYGVSSVVRSGNSLFRRTQASVSADLWIGFWNDHPNVYLPKHYIFFNAEPLGVARWRDNKEWFLAMQGAIEVWDYTMSNERIVARPGIPVRHVPFGYSPYYERTFRSHTERKGLPEDIDVLFFGTLSDRRRRVLQRVKDKGIAVVEVTRDNPLHGAKLDEAIARSRIILSVHSFDDPRSQIADFARLDHLLSNRRFVLHESLNEQDRDPAFESVVATCRYEDIPDRCAYYLAHDAERRRVAEGSHIWFKNERSLDRYVPVAEVQRYLTTIG